MHSAFTFPRTCKLKTLKLNLPFENSAGHLSGKAKQGKEDKKCFF